MNLPPEGKRKGETETHNKTGGERERERRGGRRGVMSVQNRQ